jgi:hypothetical protein
MKRINSKRQRLRTTQLLRDAAIVIGALCVPLLAASPTAAAVSDATYPLVTVSVDQAQLATQGILINGHTLLPVSDLVTRLGGKVMWDSYSKTVWAAFPDQGKTVRMMINSPVAEIYEYDDNSPHRTGKLTKTILLKQSPVLLSGRAVAPVAAAAQVVGAKVFFQPEAKHVIVESAAAQKQASR